jgi:hypothetical protein
VLGVLLTVLALQASAPEARAPAPDAELERIAKQERPRRNAVTVSPLWASKAFGTAIGYRRALSRRLTAGFQIDYLAQPPELSRLQGIGETFSLAVWPKRAFDGFLARAAFSVAHQVFAGAPKISATALVFGGDVGWGFRLPRGVLLGLSCGLRHGRGVADNPAICVRADDCPAVREGLRIRARLDLGYAF